MFPLTATQTELFGGKSSSRALSATVPVVSDSSAVEGGYEAGLDGTTNPRSRLWREYADRHPIALFER